MEPVTHVLMGACLARSGANRKAAYATVAMAVAAELPDIDALWSLRGPVASFAHHRGMTHTLVALPLEAAVVVAAVWGWHRWRERRGAVKLAAPVRWGWLYGFTLVAMLSHLLLDFTNNYGLRPFAPFNTHWYAGSIVFIFDPLIFCLLLMSWVMPWLFGLIGAEVGARREVFRGRGWAWASLVMIAGVWGLRSVEHARAVDLVAAQTVTVHKGDSATFMSPTRVQVNPDPFNPWRWHAVAELGDAGYVLAEVDDSTGDVRFGQGRFARPPETAAVKVAMGSALGRAYMDWSAMPIVTESAVDGSLTRVVTFEDPRFMADLPMMREKGHGPLTATVEVDAEGRVVRLSMRGSIQK